MSMQMRSFVYSSLGQRAISQLLFGTMRRGNLVEIPP